MNENISSTAVSGKVVETQGSVWSIVDADGIQKYAEGGCQRHYSGFADKLVGNAIDGLQDEVDKAVSGNDECFKADTIADLAKEIGVDADNLADEIEKYNTGTDAEWGKEAENMWPIATAPFYAFRISSGMLNTSGGIRICWRLHERLGRRGLWQRYLPGKRAVLRPYRSEAHREEPALASWHRCEPASASRRVRLSLLIRNEQTPGKRNLAFHHGRPSGRP